MTYKCPKCGLEQETPILSKSRNSPHTALHCCECNAWIKWANKKELKELEPPPETGMYDVSFKSITDYMNDLYMKKNHDYGNSFHDTFQEEGMSMVRVRLTDKLNRIKQLSKDEAMVHDESLMDTLIDLANYCVMTVMELGVMELGVMVNVRSEEAPW